MYRQYLWLKMIGMSGKFLYIAALVVAGAAMSCAKQIEGPVPTDGEQLVPVEITVSLESATKTSVDGEGKVAWSPGDSIAVSKFENGAGIYALTTAEGGSPAIFKGELPAGIGKVKAFYPYRYVLSNSSDANFKFKYPRTQAGKAGGVADNMVPMVSFTGSLSDSLVFHPICALAKVGVKGNDIKSITLSMTPSNPSSDNGYLWADAINISSDKWNTSTSKGSAECVMVPESGETFAPGEYYFTIITKTTADRQFDGVKLSYLDAGGKVYERSSTNPISFQRAKIYTLPGTEEDSYKGIFNAADLVAFADSVNAGKSIERFCIDDEVTLQKDIDMSSVTAWTPIGNPATVTNGNTACSYTGPSFKGVFNGNGKCIYNLKLDVTVPENGTWGLFGVLDGATVKNLALGREGDASKVSIGAAAQADAGILAGTVYNGSAIRECSNSIPLDVKGTATDNKRAAFGVFAGFACSADKSCSFDKLRNNAPVTFAAGSNTKNGATGVIVGGIAGFCTGTGSEKTVLENCENKGNLSGACGRSSGIAATMNTRTMMRYCVNRGNNVNDFANGRVANLTCIMGSGCVMDDCTNYGDCITSDSQTTTAGMIALLNADDVTVTGGGNYGSIIGANQQYHGLLAANFSKFSSVKGVYAGGSCGTYSADGKHTMHELTKDNWIQHIGYCSESNFAKVTELSSPWGTGGSVVGSLPELKDAGLRILFIGNSFTKDAVEHLPGISVAAGATDITMAHCYYGGRTIPEYYSDREVANNTFYYANPGDKKFTTWGTKASIKDVAGSGRWDVITIQEHTGNYRAWSWTSTEKEAIQNLVDYVCATQTVRPKVFYIMSQAYYDMAKIGSGSQPSITWTTQQGMYEVIVAQTKKVLEETTVDDVIATGTMLQNLRTSSCNNADDLTRDGYHMDYGISRYGAACTVFEKIVTPATGKTLEGNTFRYSGTEAGTTNVTDANAPIARTAAHHAVEKPFEVTDMKEEGGGDTPEPAALKGSGTETDPYLIVKGEDMALVGATLAEGATRYFVMTSDIDMSSITDWTPVNTENKAKNISFDGGNHKITGFKCTNKTYASLFGLVSGTVKNLVIDSPVVSNTAQLGVLATWLGNSNGSLKAEVSGVHVIDAVISMTGTGAAAVGGIAANCGASTVRGCSVSAKITHGCTSGSWNYVGGIVGKAYSTGTVITSCSFNGTIAATANKGYGFGGILGGSAADIAVTVSNCMSEGSMTGVSYAGGIVGEVCKGSSVTNCYSTMSLSGIYNLAGIVGRASNAKNPNSDANVHFDSNLNITVSGCIAWNPSLVSTNRASESPATHYSSGAVVGFSVYANTLCNCYRRQDITFSVYKDDIAQYNILNDTPDVSPTAPLVKPGDLTYLCPFNGKAAEAGDTVSSLAKTLGWDPTVWNLDSSLPALK